MQRLFLNPQGRLRHFWRTGIFFALSAFIAPFLLQYPFATVQKWLHIGDGLAAASIAFGETINLLGTEKDAALNRTAHTIDRILGRILSDFRTQPDQRKYILCRMWLQQMWSTRFNPASDYRDCHRRET